MTSNLRNLFLFLLAIVGRSAVATEPYAALGGEPTEQTLDWRLPDLPGLDENLKPAEIGWPSNLSGDPNEPNFDEIGRRDRIRRVLAWYYPKHQNTRDNTPWEVMHEIIAYGVDSQLYRGGPGGPKVNAIGWMCFNGSCKDEQLFYVDHGRIVARKGPGLQGHYGQFLAIVAQSNLQADYPLQISGKKFTLHDLVQHEQRDCQAGEELTFKLIGLMHYLRSDETWQNRDGQTWSIPRLISEELKQPIRGAACGGTHRLMGLSYAVNKRLKRGEPVTGEYRRAQMYIDDYHRYTFGLQNPDGSFSTQWFVRREAKADNDRRLKTTGHILEWLLFSLNDEELRSPRVVKAVDYLTNLLLSDPYHEWEIGPLGHGLHALVLYDSRAFSGPLPPVKLPLVDVAPPRPAAPVFREIAEQPADEHPSLVDQPACSIGNDRPSSTRTAKATPDDEGCL